ATAREDDAEENGPQRGSGRHRRLRRSASRRAVRRGGEARDGSRLPPERRLPARVLAPSTDDDDRDRVGRLDDREPGTRIVDHPVPRDLLTLVFLTETRERIARMLEHELLDRLLAVAVSRDRCRMLRTEREDGPSAVEQVVAPGLPHGAGDGAQDAEPP